jgi:peptidoglycan/LPS O-acetylase OafA/YrhL
VNNQTGGNYSYRITQLDGLRCFAVLAVIWFHWASPPYKGIFLKTSLGEIGVSLFFVLSGFLITKILLEAKSKANCTTTRFSAIRIFYIRRFLRIFPVYYATLFTLALLNIPPHREALGWHLLYLQNIYQNLTTSHIWGSHLWTLAVEEQFYLAWPFIIIFINRKYLPSIFCLLSITSLLYRFLWWMSPSLLPSPSRLLIDHLDCFGIGAILSYASITPSSKSIKTAKGFLIAGLILFLLAQTEIPGSFTLTQTAIALLCGAIIYFISTNTTGVAFRVLTNQYVVYIGTISYGLYIFHSLAPAFWLWFFWSCPIPGYRLFDRAGIPIEITNNFWIQTLLFSVITLLLSILSWHFFEKPIISLKSRFKSS